MRVTNLHLQTEAFWIEGLAKLDPIAVFVHVWPNTAHGCTLTAVCHDEAFTSSFGAMGMPWRDFIAGTDDDYLGRKLAGASRNVRYCQRIARAIIAAVKMMDDKWARQLDCCPPESVSLSSLRERDQ